MKSNRKYSKGFTLIEVMIVVTIIGILASIGYPSYTEQVLKGKRTEAKGALNELANMLEQHRYDKGTYVVEIEGGGEGSELSRAEEVYGDTTTRPSGLYTLRITASTANTYTITATPEGFTDDKCAEFILDQAGVRQLGVDATGEVDDCW